MGDLIGLRSVFYDIYESLEIDFGDYSNTPKKTFKKTNDLYFIFTKFSILIAEITTLPDHQSYFYDISSSALAFSVKASRNAVIGLAKKPGRKCDCWIVLSNYDSFIKRNHLQRVKSNTPDILSGEEYRNFWITWHSGYISLGRDNEIDPIIITSNKVQNLKYVTFDARDRNERSPIHWKFELPPMMNKTNLKTHMGGEPYWVPAESQLPDGALIGGYEKEALYVIRAEHRGSVTPGKFVPSYGVGYIPWGGAMNEKSEFEVLCGYNCIWVPSSGDRVPVGAVVGGYSEGQVREELFVGRAACDGHLIPGKVQPSHKVCYIAYKDKEIAKENFEILVVPNKNQEYANKYYIYGLECESGTESDDEDDEDDDIENDEYGREYEG